MTTHCLDIRGVVMRYGEGAAAVTALERIDLSIRPQEFVTIVGPSGCGKSTLLYLIGGFLAPSEGEILLHDKPIAGPGRDRGIVFQRYSLFPWRTVAGNIGYGLEEQGMRIIAKKNGLNPDRDITFVEARPPFLATMVRDNKIQAATLFQPFLEEAMAKGDLKVLYKNSDIYGGPTDYVFMAFDDKFLKTNPKVVRDYVEDYLIAVNWALDNRAEAVKIYAEQWKLPVPVVDSYLLTKKDYLVRRDGKLSAQSIQPVVDALAANGFIAAFDISKYLDLSYLPK